MSGGVMKMRVIPSVRAKDGNPENGVELQDKTFRIHGNTLPWQMPPFTEKVTPNGGVAAQGPAERESKSKPTIILLRLGGPGSDDDYFFTRSTQRLMSFLQRESQVKAAFTTGQFLEFLNNDHPKAVIIADHVLTIRDPNQDGYNPACGIIMEKLKKSISEGGNAVFCAYFNMAKFSDIAPFWRTHFDRPWVWLAWHCAVIEFHPAAVEHFPPNNFLKKRYNCKNQFLGHIDYGEALYNDPHDNELAGVTYGKFGKGHFGWVGADNKELANDECVYAMCGFSNLDSELDNWYPDTSVSLRTGDTGFEVGS